MDYLRLFKTLSIILGFALIFLAGWTNKVGLIFAGVGLIGVYSIFIGSESIQNRYHSLDEVSQGIFGGKYREWGDIAQGILFITLGIVLLGFGVSLYLGISQTLIRFLVRRPGAIFFALSMVCFLRTINISIGTTSNTITAAKSQPEGFFQWAEFFFSRIIPAGFMFFLCIILLGMGIIETAAPDGFDRLGGGIIETMFGDW